MRVGVNYEAASRFGRAVGKVIGGMEVDGFTDTRYYPPEDASRGELASYFIVMVAMDHRLSKPRRPYECLVEGELFHGADLLYRLGMVKYESDPEFFSPKRLAGVSREDVLRWLSCRDPRGRLVAPADADLRARLLRDLGVKLLKLYGGEAYQVLASSRGYLKSGRGDGLIDRLKVFTAYQDPVEKKGYLLAKFLERRGVLYIVDQENKEVPVDNHLSRLALRLGLVEVDEPGLERIAVQHRFTPAEDILLRLAARQAFKEASRAGGVDPFLLDDYLWAFGRKCCTRENPTCISACREACRAIPGCEGGCLLSGVCRAYRERLYMVPEHNFADTWWY